MLSALILVAALGSLPAAQPIVSREVLPGETVEVVTPPAAARPKLIPGYPVRVLCRIEHNGQAYQVWGWLDTEKSVHWFRSENPHVPAVSSVDPAKVVRNFGLDLGSLHGNAIGGTLTTNDPEFSAAWHGVELNVSASHPEHDPEGPCPGPDPCPYRPRRPDVPPDDPTPTPPPGPVDMERLVVPGILLALAGVVIVFALCRKAAAHAER